MNLELLKNKKSRLASAAALLPFTFFLTSCGLGKTSKQEAPKKEETMKKEAATPVVVKHEEASTLATPTVSANTPEGFAELLYKKEKVATWLQKHEATKARENKTYFEELERLVAQAQELKREYEDHERKRAEVTRLKRVLENAEQEVKIAAAYNYTVGKEVTLYLFTLKPLWGLFTGYAPTTSTVTQEEALQLARETTGKEKEAKENELQVSEVRLRRLLGDLENRFETALNKTNSAAERADLLSSKAAHTTVVNKLLVAAKALEAHEENYRKHLSALHPSLPYALAKAAPAVEKDFVGDFLQDEQTKAQENLKAQNLKFKNLFMLEAGEGLSKLSTYVLLARAAEALRATEAEAMTKKAELKALERAVEEAKAANPEFENMLRAENFEAVEEAVTADANEYAGNVELMKAVEALRKQVSTVNGYLLHVAQYEAEGRTLADKLVLAQEALKEAKRQRFSLFKELGLYLFGFKFIWGASEGYAPTVNVEAEELALRAAEEELKQFQTLNEENVNNARTQLKIAVNSLADKYATAKNRAKTAFQKAVLAKYYGQFNNLLTQYSTVLDKQAANRTLFVDEIKAGTLYRGGKSTFISFLEYFAPKLDLTARYDAKNEKNANVAIGVKELPAAKLVSDVLQAESQNTLAPTKAAKEAENFDEVPKMYEDFVTTTGAELLAELTKELEGQLAAYQTAKLAEETQKSTKAKLNSGLQATAVVDTKKQ